MNKPQIEQRNLTSRALLALFQHPAVVSEKLGILAALHGLLRWKGALGGILVALRDSLRRQGALGCIARRQAVQPATSRTPRKMTLSLALLVTHTLRYSMLLSTLLDGGAGR